MPLIKQLYEDTKKLLFSNEVKEVFEVFKEYFGEDYVDIQFKEDCYSSFKDALHNITLGNIKKGSVLDDILRVSDIISLQKEAISLYRNNEIDKDRYINYVKNYIGFNYIIVHFPTITVTNEHEHSTIIHDVYIKVSVDYTGKFVNDFQIIRATFNEDQLNTGYIHSHTPRNNSIVNANSWQHMCLGTGPIISTIHTIKEHYDLDFWRLFCVELNEYLKVESISGVPYIKLNSIGTNASSLSYNVNMSNADTLADLYLGRPLYVNFINFIISSVCKDPSLFVCLDNYIDFSCSNIDFAIKVTKYFIDYYNSIGKKYATLSDLLDESVLVEVQKDNYGNLVYKSANNAFNIDGTSDKCVLVFKGERKFLKVINRKEVTEKHIYLLNSHIVSELGTYLLNRINYEHIAKSPYYNEEPIFI